MTQKEAWDILAQVGAKFVGTLNDHQAVQKALEVLKPKEEVKES